MAESSLPNARHPAATTWRRITFVFVRRVLRAATAAEALGGQREVAIDGKRVVQDAADGTGPAAMRRHGSFLLCFGVEGIELRRSARCAETRRSIDF
jgi:hypothetical protein